MKGHHCAINHHAPSLSTYPHAASASRPRFADAKNASGSLETLAFQQSPHFGFSESYRQKPRPRATLFTSKAAMDTQNVQEEAAESDTVTYLRCGMISILDVIAVKLPDVFTAEILPKLDMTDTLSLAQVNKAYNAAVWSADGVRSMEAKIKAHFDKIGKKGRITQPLYLAVAFGNVSAVRALLESGVDVNKSVTFGSENRALHFAAHLCDAALVKALIEAGADVNKTAGDNRTALIIAINRGQASCVVELIKGGADVNLASNDVTTPLSEAIIHGHDAIVGMLLLAGADVGKAVSNIRPYHIALAKSYKHENIMKLLEQFGA